MEFIEQYFNEQSNDELRTVPREFFQAFHKDIDSLYKRFGIRGLLEYTLIMYRRLEGKYKGCFMYTNQLRALLFYNHQAESYLCEHVYYHADFLENYDSQGNLSKYFDEYYESRGILDFFEEVIRIYRCMPEVSPTGNKDLDFVNTWKLLVGNVAADYKQQSPKLSWDDREKAEDRAKKIRNYLEQTVLIGDGGSGVTELAKTACILSYKASFIPISIQQLAAFIKANRINLCKCVGIIYGFLDLAKWPDDSDKFETPSKYSPFSYDDEGPRPPQTTMEHVESCKGACCIFLARMDALPVKDVKTRIHTSKSMTSDFVSWYGIEQISSIAENAQCGYNLHWKNSRRNPLYLTNQEFMPEFPRTVMSPDNDIPNKTSYLNNIRSFINDNWYIEDLNNSQVPIRSLLEHCIGRLYKGNGDEPFSYDELVYGYLFYKSGTTENILNALCLLAGLAYIFGSHYDIVGKIIYAVSVTIVIQLGIPVTLTNIELPTERLDLADYVRFGKALLGIV